VIYSWIINHGGNRFKEIFYNLKLNNFNLELNFTVVWWFRAHSARTNRPSGPKFRAPDHLGALIVAASAVIGGINPTGRQSLVAPVDGCYLPNEHGV
jgi:hypothetical protein